METTKVPFNRCLDKEEVVHVYDGILLSHKKWWSTAICDNMDGSWEHNTKQNKPDRKSQEPPDFTPMWDIKLKTTNQQIRQTN